MKKSKNLYISIIMCILCLAWFSFIYFTKPVSAEMHTDLNYVAVDLDYNVHYLNSLPDGTKDNYNSITNQLTKNVKVRTFTNDTGWYYNSLNDTVAVGLFADNVNNFSMDNVASVNGLCNIANEVLDISIWNASGYWRYIKAPTNTILVLSILKSELFSLDNNGVRLWINDKITEYGNITFMYEYSTPQAIQILPDGYMPVSELYDFMTKNSDGILSQKNISITADLEYEVSTISNIDITSFVTFNYYNIDFLTVGSLYEYDISLRSLISADLTIHFLKPFYYHDNIFIKADSDVSDIEFLDINNVSYFAERDFTSNRLIFPSGANLSKPIKSISIFCGRGDILGTISIFQDNSLYYSGYNSGYNVGKSDGFSSGNQFGYAKGYSAGVNDSVGDYQAGYNAGVSVTNANNNAFLGLFPALFGSVSFFFTNTLGGMTLFGLSVLDIVLTLTAISVFLIFIKIFRG